MILLPKLASYPVSKRRDEFQNKNSFDYWNNTNIRAKENHEIGKIVLLEGYQNQKKLNFSGI